MERVVIDTSVAVKWFVEESGSQKAVKILEDYQEGHIKITAPEIISLELANALYFAARFKGKILKEALSSFYRLGLSLIPLSEPLLQESSLYMQKFNIGIYDALFISLAEKEKISLITADKKHHRKRFSRFIKYLD